MSHRIAFLEPKSVAEAIAALVEYGEGARVVSGATAITILLRRRLIDPDVLVSLGRIHDLRSIDVSSAGEIRLGALVTHRQVELDPTAARLIPIVPSTFGQVANVRIRNAATVGGVCAEADYASDPPCVLVALDAQIEASSTAGPRLIPAANFFIGFYETALEPSEIITQVRIPVPASGLVGVYKKYRTRSSEDRPCIGVAALVNLAPDGRTCQELRVSVGAAAEVPQRFREIESAAAGHEFNAELVDKVAEQYAELIDTLDDIRGSAWYRSEMIRIWVRRALQQARDLAVSEIAT